MSIASVQLGISSFLLFRGGRAISINTQPGVPAGWYTDPAGSGAKRWWDGVQWTSHLQAQAPAAATALVVQQPQRADPYTTQGPYGTGYGLAATNGTVYGSQNGYSPYNNGYAPVPLQQVHQQHNSAAIGSVIFGGLAFCLSLVGLLPGSPVFYYSAGGVFAIVGGVRALVRRRQGYGTSIVLPVVAIVLGSLAVVFMITGILIHLSGGYSSGTATTTSNAQAQVSGGAATIDPTATVPAAPTFATDAQLTSYEQEAGKVALYVDQYANGGLAYAANPLWPAALTVTSDGTILLPPGTSPGQLPTGEELRYVLSGDKQSFDVFITGGNHQEIAIYDSSTNSFTWTCAASDSTCPPGGLTQNSGGSTTTS